jgi:hypothetical protein
LRKICDCGRVGIYRIRQLLFGVECSRFLSELPALGEYQGAARVLRKSRSSRELVYTGLGKIMEVSIVVDFLVNCWAGEGIREASVVCFESEY